MSEKNDPTNPEPSSPQFGQRSDSWTPQNEGQPAPNSGQNSPWPVYGQGGPGPQSPYGGPNQYASSAPNTGNGPSGPMMPGPAYGMGGPTGYTGPQGQLPSRTWPILTLVFGVILMIPVPLVVFFSMVVSSVDLSQFSTGMTTNGGTISVDESGVVGIVSDRSLEECTLENDSESHTLYAGSDGIVSGRGITPGTYTLDCGVSQNGATLVVMSDIAIDSFMDGTMTGLIVSTVIGLAGLGLLIGGIVWLVMRNRKRREYLRVGMY